jgi:hypothetical protein
VLAGCYQNVIKKEVRVLVQSYPAAASDRFAQRRHYSWPAAAARRRIAAMLAVNLVFSGLFGSCLELSVADSVLDAPPGADSAF